VSLTRELSISHQVARALGRRLRENGNPELPAVHARCGERRRAGHARLLIHQRACLGGLQFFVPARLDDLRGRASAEGAGADPRRARPAREAMAATTPGPTRFPVHGYFTARSRRYRWAWMMAGHRPEAGFKRRRQRPDRGDLGSIAINDEITTRVRLEPEPGNFRSLDGRGVRRVGRGVRSWLAGELPSFRPRCSGA